MKKLKYFIVLCLVIIAGCFGSGNKNESEDETKQGSKWPLVTPVFGSDKINFADITSPKSIIDTAGKSDVEVCEELQTALEKGGIIVFNTHGTSRTVKITKQFYIPVQGNPSNDYGAPVVLDGGGLVTLDGGMDNEGNGGTRILEKAWKVNLTIQRMNFINANSENSTREKDKDKDDKSGGAINVENWDGSLCIIECNFTNCTSKRSGPDVGGGAVHCPGQKRVIFYNCNFDACIGSNGGAIDSLGSELWILNCKFNKCSANGTGGGAEVGESGQGGIGGAVYIDGISINAASPILRIENSTFTDNTANEHGGAVFLYTYENTGSKSLIKETIFKNNVINGTRGFGGAIYSQNGSVEIMSSTFDSNRSASMGGAVWHLSNEKAVFGNCTFSGNLSGNFGSALQLNGEAYISSCTIADNECMGEYGGAVRSGTPEKTWMKNTVLSNNICKNNNIGNVSDTYQDGGGNYQWPYSATQKKGTAGIVFANPYLGQLADNGGKTFTRKPAENSLTINGGTDNECLTVDQCGKSRTGVCDSGAVEN